MNGKLNRAIVSIYIDPDFYPPTINAILNLAERFEEVVVVCRNNTTTDFPYPRNVYLKKIGKACTVREMERQSVWLKAFYFSKFVFYFLRYMRSSKTSLVLLYDSIALYGFYLVKNVIKTNRKKIWYHNHDMPAESLIQQFSVGGLAAKYEKRAMQYIDFFSLPSEDRTHCYQQIAGNFPVFIIPNYPSLKLYHCYHYLRKEEGILKIIFQGFIGPGLGLESFIELLSERIKGNSLHLILKGSVKEEYKEKLNALAEKLEVASQVKWVPIGPYNELIKLTSSCDVGIGINMNTDTISKTLGTASNKIYEYAACGLPVLLFDSENYRRYLNKYDWTFFTDGSVYSLKENIELLTEDLPKVSNSARLCFEQSLNFETIFLPVLNEVLYFKKINHKEDPV